MPNPFNSPEDLLKYQKEMEEKGYTIIRTEGPNFSEQKTSNCEICNKTSYGTIFNKCMPHYYCKYHFYIYALNLHKLTDKGDFLCQDQ